VIVDGEPGGDKRLGRYEPYESIIDGPDDLGDRQSVKRSAEAIMAAEQTVTFLFFALSRLTLFLCPFFLCIFSLYKFSLLNALPPDRSGRSKIGERKRVLSF